MDFRKILLYKIYENPSSGSGVRCRRTDLRIDGETNRWRDGRDRRDVTNTIFFFAILKATLKIGPNCPLLQNSALRDVGSLEIRLALSKKLKKITSPFFLSY
jgi:hypothetical protein